MQEGSVAEGYDESVNYYDLFWRKFLLNDVAMRQIGEMRSGNSSFGRKLKKI
jgi:hypothetical protein